MPDDRLGGHADIARDDEQVQVRGLIFSSLSGFSRTQRNIPSQYSVPYSTTGKC